MIKKYEELNIACWKQKIGKKKYRMVRGEIRGSENTSTDCVGFETETDIFETFLNRTLSIIINLKCLLIWLKTAEWLIEGKH
jgi:hypothetical protein